MPRLVSSRASKTKQVCCTHCGQTCEVASRAMSIFCPHCRKRLILENFKITTYYAVRDFSTCGDIVVEKTGHVVAPIKAGNLVVKGKVQGAVHARGEVTIGKSGSLKGEVEAASIIVEAGAVLDAFVRIGSDPIKSAQINANKQPTGAENTSSPGNRRTDGSIARNDTFSS